MTAELGLTDNTPALSLANAGIAFAPAVTPDTYQESFLLLPTPESESIMFPFDLSESEHRSSGRRTRKGGGSSAKDNHIPRPPNAFILFRSAFIKSQRVTSGVESSHSTLSKIIGMTWQQLSNEERQKWHAKAKMAQEEHKRRYPQYSFKPIHSRLKGGGGPNTAATRRKLREVGPKDQKRCEKIAELLAIGKKGRELEEDIKEFDKHHVPLIVTRFEVPITASSYSSRSPSTGSQGGRRSTSAASSSSRSTNIPTPLLEEEQPLLSFDSNTFFQPNHNTPPPPPHSFDIPTTTTSHFAFSLQPPSPTDPSVVVQDGYADSFHFAPAIDESWTPSPRSSISTTTTGHTGSLPTTPANDPSIVTTYPGDSQNLIYTHRHCDDLYPPFTTTAAADTSEKYHHHSTTDFSRQFPSYVSSNYAAATGYHHAQYHHVADPSVQHQHHHQSSHYEAKGILGNVVVVPSVVGDDDSNSNNNNNLSTATTGCLHHPHPSAVVAREDFEFSMFMDSLGTYPL